MHRLTSTSDLAHQLTAWIALAATTLPFGPFALSRKSVHQDDSLKQGRIEPPAAAGPTIKSVLLITQYYPPEIGGGAVRSSGIAEALQRSGIDVTVVAPFATYLMRDHERATSWKFWEQQSIAGVRVVRSFVIAPDRVHKIKRILYYLSFACSAVINSIAHVRDVDAIIVISPPLLTGITGVLVNLVKKARLMFDVGDIWPESAIALGFVKGRTMIRLLEGLERWIYRHSDAVNVVTRHTHARFRTMHPEIRNTFYVPNFVDTRAITKQAKDAHLTAELGLHGKTVFGYAGNIGSAQGITIMTEAARLLRDRADIVFLIIGGGIEGAKIEADIRTHRLENVVFIPPIAKDEIGRYLSLFDYAIIPLVKSPLFQITIPSKLYECMAAEIPVILCVDGEARRVLEDADAGIFVEPGDAVMLAETIAEAAAHRSDAERMGRNGRAYALKHFDRDRVVADLRQRLESLGAPPEDAERQQEYSRRMANQ